VRVDFSPTSAGPFGPLLVTGAPFLGVWSGPGAGCGLVPVPPTPWGRVSVANSTSDVATFTLFSLNRH
jgi:hypothetical protein